jgi:predicted Ser/Thr protein kinase
MAVTVRCPNPACATSYRAPDGSLGRTARCRKCGQTFALSSPAVAAASGASRSPSFTPIEPPELPEQFGRYRIVRRLGQGGMGAVYLAVDTKLGREVALKVPHFSPGDGPEILERFYREARAAATFDHPNLCPVYDVGQVDGIHYLTMPYIEGQPLSDLVAGGRRLEPKQAAAVVRKLARALAEAHAKGVIHRDLKPSNVMVSWRRDLVVMDFGLARLSQAHDPGLTRSGALLGTPAYMAPEQVRGEPGAIGPACDVYALGVILYELLTGRRPFEGPAALVLGLIAVAEPDPPSTHRPGLDPAPEAICRKAMAKRVEDRYASMDELARALEAYLAAPQPAARPDGPGHEPLASSESSRAGNDPLAAIGLDGLASNPQGPVPRPGQGRGRGRRRALVAGIVGAVAVLASVGVALSFASRGGSRRDGGDDPKPRVEEPGLVARNEGSGAPATTKVGPPEPRSPESPKSAMPPRDAQGLASPPAIPSPPVGDGGAQASARPPEAPAEPRTEGPGPEVKAVERAAVQPVASSKSEVPSKAISSKPAVAGFTLVITARTAPQRRAGTDGSDRLQFFVVFNGDLRTARPLTGARGSLNPGGEATIEVECDFPLSKVRTVGIAVKGSDAWLGRSITFEFVQDGRRSDPQTFGPVGWLSGDKADRKFGARPAVNYPVKVHFPAQKRR